MTACINGCCRRPKVEGEAPVPKEATHGRLCAGCCRKLEDWLKDIPVDFALLDMALVSGGAQRYDGSGRTKQPEAPAPLRLEVAALSDRRSGYSGLREAGDELWYETPDIARVLPILHNWAEQLRCDLDPTRDFHDLTDEHTVTGATNYLLAALQRLSEADWVDEAMTELRTVWNSLCRAHGLIVGDSLGDCFDVNCAGKVYRDRFTGFPTCNVCHRVYDGLDLVRLKITEEIA